MKTVGIIGGGASGLIAALSAADHHAKVILFEQKNRIGKKLLATGNGRCNLTNIDASAKDYHGQDNAFVQYALDAFSPTATIAFFQSLGLLTQTEEGGRVYPYSSQAAAVLDILRFATAKRGITVMQDIAINRIQKCNDKFALYANKKVAETDAVIIATGGCAAPALGADGSGFLLLESFGHSIIEPVPALCQLKTDNVFTKALQGVKLTADISAWSNQEWLDCASGDVLFTDYGVSGSAIMDISRVLYTRKPIILKLDLVPNFSHAQLYNELCLQKERLSHLTMEDFFVGLLPKKVGQQLAKSCGLEKLSVLVSAIDNDWLLTVAHKIKELPLTITGHNGWDNAQVTAGGAATAAFNAKTMESLLVPGLYAAGEVLDIFGDCGGYNLQWAWSSGYIAGQHATKI